MSTGPLPSLRECNREQRRRTILTQATALFGQKGIEPTTMEQIVEAAGIGSATLYRYFPSKNDIAVAAVIDAWQQRSQRYLPHITSDAFQEKNGRAQIYDILEIFIDLYDHDTDFLRLLLAFDSYVQNGQISADQLEAYEQVIIFLQSYAVAALNKGAADGSLHLSQPPELVYFTVFHAMLSLTAKLACQGHILHMDAAVNGRDELLLLRDLLMRGLT